MCAPVTTATPQTNPGNTPPQRAPGGIRNPTPPPRYAEQAVDQQSARWVMLHVQSNPLPICTRPRVLIKGKRT